MADGQDRTNHKPPRPGELGWLDFEKPILEMERRIEDLRASSSQEAKGLAEEIRRLEKKAEKLRQEIYSSLTRIQKVQLARHPKRPYCLDYIGKLFTDFVELQGDRLFREDRAIVAGLARFHGEPVVVVGQQKGRNTKENLTRNFGMPHPEGYRKALRVMQLAARFGNPILTLVDTPGAYPGIGAEERGQAEAIARNIREMTRLAVPLVVVIIGEGGSGGALAIAVGDRILMLENSIYSVISPEGCAAILWKDRAKASVAAEALRLTAADLVELGVVDRVIPEPLGGAHRDFASTFAAVDTALVETLSDLRGVDPEERVRRRREKFLAMGVFTEA